jgi:CubicO group peptidase (beta-lactamase class C family)
MKITALLWLGLACGLAVGCSGDDDDDTPGVDAGGPDAAGAGEFAAFDEAITTFMEDSGLVGASAVVIDRELGQLHIQGYGEFDADRLYLVASSSKIVSVGVLMRLADQGMVDMDAPIGMYVEEAFGPGKPELTLAQLLSNSSGLVSLTDNATYAPYLCQYVSAGTLTDCAEAIYTADDAADRIPPDTEFHYGGGQWQLAGGVAEVVSGKSWQELLEETYTTPCGTESLGYGNEFERSALSYPTYFEGDVANLTPTENPSIEGGAYINVEDYGKIVQMHLRGGLCGETEVLSEESVARMQADRILEVYDGSTGVGGSMAGYGLGWWIDRTNEGVVTDPGAYGSVAWLDVPRGYGAFIAIEGEAAQGVVLAGNAKVAVDQIIDARRARSR